MKKALWLVLAALPLAFAAAPAPSKGSTQSKPAVTQVVKKGLKKTVHKVKRRKVVRHVRHVTKKASPHKVKPVKKP
ncbi:MULTISPECIES: hypothetical protein [unclassified Meiothermus]|uniref:hypothetical protein n=1 Tax=unclassified Meiothermus TaxID=370471 RepID=UPI000D7C77F2|nr:MULTISPECIES: hypothetical protein [unclassified Meiothermus]PZA07936.1 hypothetical protein DNA98_06465 [Meiothermus sp. Pnk-1]RYM36717.1 hypothetical protein EWH23_08740 [Meiothermus sp. PNK-Is4]